MSSIRNPFALLSDDPDDVVAPTPAAAAAPAPAITPSAAKKPGQAQQQTQRSNTNGKSQQPRRGGAAGGNDRQAATESNDPDATRDVRGPRTAGQRGGRGSGSARGPRGGRGGRGSGANRPLDRHSQTDRVDSHKQEHQAWGGDEGKRELDDENAGEQDAQAAASGVATPIGGEAASTPAPVAQAPIEKAPEVEQEPEDNTQTYEEYLAAQKAKAAAAVGGSLPEARKANEGVDEAQWKNAKPLTKEEEADVYFASTKEGKARKQKEKKEKTFIEFEPQYPRPDRGTGGRGGSRGGRGGEDRGRGAGRGGGRGRGEARGGAAARGNGPSARSNNQASIDTSDSSAFPSLS